MGRQHRYRSVVAATTVVAVGCVAAGVVAGSSSAQTIAGATTAPGATTAVLSARRVPDLLARPTAGRRLSAAVAPLVASAPADRCVVIGQGGQRLFDDGGANALIPGSNLKLATATAVLDELGPDTTFTTVLSARAKPSADGTIAGDLWFVGGGDPLIVTDPYRATNKFGMDVPHTSLEAIADKVAAAGVKRINGKVVGDESRYDTVRTVPSWPTRYLGDGQIGPLSALSVNDSRTAAAVIGGPAVSVRPAADPAEYAASSLTSLLATRGVSVTGVAASGPAPEGAVAIVEVASLPVRGIVSEMLTYSDNNTAELMLKEVGLHRSKHGTTAAGTAAVVDTLTARSIDTTGFVAKDGSGLDTGDRVSCHTLTDALEAGGPTGDLANGLSTAGAVGTLFDRYTRSPAIGHVRAKTGTLNNVTALSGWVTTTKNADLAFSIIFNGRPVTAADERLEERITEAMLDYPNGPDRATIGPEAAP